MSGCLAITLRGSACRAYAEMDKVCCKQHSNYFEDVIDSWIVKEHAILIGEGIYYRIEEALRRKLVIIDKSFFNEDYFIRSPRKWWHFILLCSRHTPLESLHPRIWDSTVKILWSQTPIVRHPSRVSWKDIQRFICVKGDIGAFFRGLKLYPRNDDMLYAMSPRLWMQFFESCTEDAEWFLEFAMSEREDISFQFFEGIEFWIHRRKMEILKERSLPLEVRADILAIGGHPSRVISWFGEDLLGIWNDSCTKRESLRSVVESIKFE
jgi:hypothetical protein